MGLPECFHQNAYGLTKMRIQTVDLGSSSIRAALFDLDRGGDGHVEPIAAAHEHLDAGDTALALKVALAQTTTHGRPEAISHRVVLASNADEGPALATEEVLRRLEAASEAEPLHLAPQVALIRALAREYPDVPQVLCSDSMFFSGMPAIARRLPLPAAIAPIERHGYHGLSYEFVSSVLGTMRGRTVIAHLGSGASMCALLDGRPIDSTMGYSPLGGLMMATRPGDLDPGVVLYLLRTANMDVTALSDLFYKRSGVLAISETTGDMRRLLELMPADAAAREAVELFVYNLRKQLGAMVAALGGLDCLVFTGGIGENSLEIREALCSKLRYLGVILSNSSNRRGDTVISTNASDVTVMVVRTNESLMLARHAFRTLSGARGRQA